MEEIPRWVVVASPLEPLTDSDSQGPALPELLQWTRSFPRFANVACPKARKRTIHASFMRCRMSSRYGTIPTRRHRLCDVEDAPVGASTGAERVNPAVRAYLGLFADPALTVSVRSWGGGRTYLHEVAVLSGHATSLVRTQRLDDRGQNPLNEDSVELSAFTFPELIGELLRSLREIDTGRPAGAVANGSIELPLTELQGLITAIRSDRPGIIEGAMQEVAISAASLPIVRAASFGIDAGFTVFARSRATGDQFSSHWFRANSGWFELALSTPPVDSVTSSIEFADRSRVRLSTRGSEAIVATVITAIGTLGGALHG